MDENAESRTNPLEYLVVRFLRLIDDEDVPDFDTQQRRDAFRFAARFGEKKQASIVSDELQKSAAFVLPTTAVLIVVDVVAGTSISPQGLAILIQIHGSLLLAKSSVRGQTTLNSLPYREDFKALHRREMTTTSALTLAGTLILFFGFFVQLLVVVAGSI